MGGGLEGTTWITNNTIVANRGSGINITNPGMTVAIRNNIIADNGAWGIDSWGSDPATIVANMFWGNRGTIFIAGYTGIYGSNVVMSPMLIAPDRDDWHLHPCSPAIDSGVSDSVPDHDGDGERRPVGRGTDIGAYESRDSANCRRVYLPQGARAVH